MSSSVVKLPTIASLGSDDCRLLVESVLDYAIFMLDPEGHVLTWNAGAEKIKGYRPDEIVGKHFSVFFPLSDVASGKPQRELEEAARLGRFEDEGWRVRKDGTRFWANVVVTALRDETGKLRGFGKVTRDLTERRRAEEALRVAEQRFHHLVDAVLDYAIYMLDAEGRVSTWNAGARRLKGYDRDEIVGRHFSVFYTAEDRARQRPQEILEVVGREGRFEDEAWRVRKDGTRFWANVVITALHDSEGNLIGFAKVTRDLTLRREAEENERTLIRERTAREVAEREEHKLRESEERYRAAAEAAAEASRAKDEFLATVSHELRTPLNAILGWATLLKERVSDSALAKALEVIHRNAHAQARIIEDILDVSRVVTGKLRLEPRPVDLVDVARQAAEVVRPTALAKGVRLELNVDPPSCILLADEQRLQQVIWNLLSNAVKFTQSDGAVVLSVRQVRSHARIEVSDTGRGIEPEFLPYVFDRFRQADASPTRRIGGLGLGLALVRHITELHGGSVHVSSEGINRGATFRVELPISAVFRSTLQKHDSVERVSSEQSRISPLTGVEILVVDDECDARDVVAAVLEDAGASVRVATSVEEAMTFLERFTPRVILSDIAMPGEDGVSFIHRVRRVPELKQVPALALTAYARDADRTRVLEAGFDAHLAKPVEPRGLVSAIAELLR